MRIGDWGRDEKPGQDALTLDQVLTDRLLLTEQALSALFMGLLSNALALLEDPSPIQLDDGLDPTFVDEQALGHDPYKVPDRLKSFGVAEAAEKFDQGSSIVVLRLMRHSALVPQPREPARAD
jgi:hypothetical protein